jgi:hypothetical protein
MKNTKQKNDPWTYSGNGWPLIFSYRVPLEVQGVTARIELSGRATAYVEDDTVWIDGVNPGSFTASGDNFKMAEEDLRSTLTEIFLDIAEGSAGFAQFKGQANDFLLSTDDDTVEEWNAALARVRSSSMLDAPELPRRSADESSPFVEITRESDNSSNPLLFPDRPHSAVELLTAA